MTETPRTADKGITGTRLDDIRARAKAGQPMKAFWYYRANGLWDSFRPFIEEAQEDRKTLLLALDEVEAAQDATRQREEAVDRLLDQVLLEAAHYNKFQGKVAHANLRMILDAARNRTLLRATEGKQQP